LVEASRFRGETQWLAAINHDPIGFWSIFHQRNHLVDKVQKRHGTRIHSIAFVVGSKGPLPLIALKLHYRMPELVVVKMLYLVALAL
jgi:hypothetical protein